MQLRLPEVYCDAKQAIEDSLESRRLLLSKYNSTMQNLCEVTHFNIKEEEDKERVGDIELLISYKERMITKYDSFETLNKTQTLRVLTTKGDTLWPYLMITKVWDGEYPSGVAINEETGVVYLLYLRMNALSLVEFALLRENEKEAIKENLNEVQPYRIRLDEDAMFNVLAEIEGNRHLHEKVCIEFDCGTKFRVYSDRPFDI